MQVFYESSYNIYILKELVDGSFWYLQYINSVPLNLDSELGGLWGISYHSPWLCYLTPSWQSQQIYVAADGSYMRNPEMCHFTTLLMHLHKQLNPLYTPSCLFCLEKI